MLGLPSVMTSAIYFLGMLSIFIGERAIGAGTSRGAVTGFGVALVVIATAIRAMKATRSDGERRTIEHTLLWLYVTGLGAVVVYFIQSDLITKVASHALDRDYPRLATVLAALWPVAWLASTLPIVLVEMAYASIALAPKLEVARIRDAMYTGLGIAGALVFAFSTYYVSSERDKKVDLSYFRTAKPGEATRKLVRSFDQPIQVALFFPPANEVESQVSEYFKDLAGENKLLEVKNYDHALEPAKAKELGVSGNGTIAIVRGARKELMNIGTNLESARGALRNLDKDAQKRFLQVARPTKNVYFTSGHGERTNDALNETDKRATVRELREALQQQNYSLRNLGAAEGLATDIPADAAAVLVLGPQKPFLAEEIAALKRYFEHGGHLFIALDPESGLDMKELLSGFGVTYTPKTLANDQIFARKAHQQSDRANIATGSYSSHPSVTTLSKLGMRAPIILAGAGYFEEIKDKPKDLSIDFTVRAHPATWNDLDGNFNFDPPAETRKAWQLAAAVTKKAEPPKDQGEAKDKPKGKEDSRAVLLGDSDALCDGVIGNPGNAYFVIDALKWLLGDEALAGETTTETDVPIQHTRKQDAAWFYSSIFMAPILVIGVGLLATGRRRKQKRAAARTQSKENA
jgi:hypothetical protein